MWGLPFLIHFPSISGKRWRSRNENLVLATVCWHLRCRALPRPLVRCSGAPNHDQRRALGQGIMPYAGGCAVWSVCNYKILQTQIVMVARMYTVMIFMTSSLSHFLRCSVSLRLRYGQPWLRSVRCEASRGNHCEAPAGENPALAQPPKVGLSGNLQGPGLGCWGKGGDRM